MKTKRMYKVVYSDATGKNEVSFILNGRAAKRLIQRDYEEVERKERYIKNVSYA